MTRLLLVEDERSIAEALTVTLEAEGFEVVWIADGSEAETTWERVRPDLIVLDVMLPGRSGTDVCRAIRSRSDVPIIMLTARDTEVDRVVGLELGADDYVTKPFSTRELIARIRAVLRRGGAVLSVDERPYEVAGVRVDRARREVHVDGDLVDLAPKEFDLVALLVEHAGRVLTRRQIIDEVWGSDYVGDTKTLDVHIRRIRRRIEADPAQPVRVETVRGVGYRFSDRSPGLERGGR